MLQFLTSTNKPSKYLQCKGKAQKGPNWKFKVTLIICKAHKFEVRSAYIVFVDRGEGAVWIASFKLQVGI